MVNLMIHVIKQNDLKNNYNRIGPIILLAKFSLNNIV
jgi:hypothetical protein